MSERNVIVVLHGITMSGASMLRSLGPLGAALEAEGFELVAPDAGHRMSDDEVASILGWMRPHYEAAGQRLDDDFCDGRFWTGDRRHEWFQVRTDDAGRKHYDALETGLARVVDALAGKRLVGLVGFSQGAAMGVVLAALAAAGDPRFAGLRFGVFLSGFRPVFDVPSIVRYPIVSALPRFVLVGERDPVFKGGQAQIDAFAAGFEGGAQTSVVVPTLAHDVPSDPETVERIVAFARAAAA